MIKGSVVTRSFYLENPFTAGRPLMGTSVSIAMENDGGCLVGDSPIKWDEAAKKPTLPTEFSHNEYRSHTEQAAVDIINGKVETLIAGGYVFEVILNVRHLMQTNQYVYDVYEHKPGKPA